jgi:hypothetical protein
MLIGVLVTTGRGVRRLAINLLANYDAIPMTSFHCAPVEGNSRQKWRRARCQMRQLHICEFPEGI